ncbi:hypothetical protein JZ785_11855 [Alicyclobacillus curvatus]|nr:hypothetical protein JZ785_11855 [Alicyclobacillus curvatus]
MMEFISSWFIERCPYCHEKLTVTSEGRSIIRSCPNQHYASESNTVLGVDVEYHRQESTPTLQ